MLQVDFHIYNISMIQYYRCCGVSLYICSEKCIKKDLRSGHNASYNQEPVYIITATFETQETLKCQHI